MTSFFAQAPAPSAPLLTAFQDIQRHFFERRFTLDGTGGLILLAIAVLVLLLACGIIYGAVKHRRKQYVPQDWVTNPKDIRDALQTSFDQRVHFSLHFNPGRFTRPTMYCIGNRIDHDYMLLEVLGLKDLSRQWVGQEFEGFFQILEKGQSRYLAFFSVLESIFTRDSHCFLRAELPAKLEARQKRSYLRIIPPEEYMLGAAIWFGDAIPSREKRLRVAGWAKPTRALLPAVAHQFSIRDLSAGGIRLHIEPEQIPENHAVFNANKDIMFMLDLWDPDKQRRLRFWMDSRIRNSFIDVKTHALHLGIQFRSWARPKEDGSDNDLEWLHLSRAGEIEALGNWIMRRHLEFYRETDSDQAASRLA